MNQKVIIQFINYSPRIYSGFDRYNLVLARKLVALGYLPVFVFTDSISLVPLIATDLEAIGAQIELIPTKGNKQLITAYWHLYTKYKPLVVHTHFVEFSKIATALFSLLFGSKHFTSFHSTISLLPATDYQKKKGLIKRVSLLFFYKLLLLCSNRIFTVSEAIKDQFLDFASSHSSKIQKLYLGVDLKKNEKTQTELRSYLQLPQDIVLLCNISAFEPIKGLDIMCKAVFILKNKYKVQNFKFCHLGGLRSEDNISKTYRDSIYALAKELDIENEINWLGHRNDIGDIVSAFDIYVHPSRMEGLGVANMEAATQSLPIVGTNVGGIPEIVLNGVNGYLFESENAEQLAECIFKLIKDKALREKMGEASYKIVSENFSIEKQTDALIDYYNLK
ncbi:MAG: glycosyltransferase family 4 protein [Paludibacter sp.]